MKFQGCLKFCKMASSFHAISMAMAITLSLISLIPTLVSASANKTQMINEFLDGHNAARRAVGVPTLAWDPSLANYARLYSNQRRKDCKLVHSPGYAYGETLFWGKGKKWSAKDAVSAWVAEKKWYRYSDNSCSGQQCSHYTQVVWRTTKYVGCAKIICTSGDTFMACEYYPPGNYIGQRPYEKKQTTTSP